MASSLLAAASAAARDLERALLDLQFHPEDARAAAADFLDGSARALNPDTAFSEDSPGGPDPTATEVARDLERALLEMGVPAADAIQAGREFASDEASSANALPPVEDTAVPDPSPRQVAEDLRRALVESGVSDPEARESAADFVSSAEQQAVTEEIGVDHPAAAADPSPEDLAQDLERALIDSGFASYEARQAAEDFRAGLPEAATDR